MCPQNPSELVVEYRKEQRLLLYETEIVEVLEKIRNIGNNIGQSNQEPNEECNNFIAKLEDCKC